jgi:predicted NBD/HSP70 family sugar kinase
LLSVDIGGSKVAVALVDGARIIEQRRVPTEAEAGPEAIVARVVELSRELVALAPDPPPALGIACAGLVEQGCVNALSPDLLPGWHGFPIEHALSEALGLPSYALNDGQAAALGEACYGAGRDRESLLFVTVSTGIGGGLVLNGRLWRGRYGLAGHIGYLSSDPDGPVASVGRAGVLESVASGTALANRAVQRGHRGDARSVIAAAEAGEDWAEEVVGDAIAALARAITDVQTVVAPEVVVLGGGVGLNPAFFARLRASLATLPDPLRPELRAAALGDAAGLVGAGVWAEEVEQGYGEPLAPAVAPTAT